MSKLANLDELVRVGEARAARDRGATPGRHDDLRRHGHLWHRGHARDTFRAIQDELARRGIEASVEGVGCIGLCFKEPLVDIQQPGQPRVTYGNIGPDKVLRIIEEHVVKGMPVKSWVDGHVPEDY